MTPKSFRAASRVFWGAASVACVVSAAVAAPTDIVPRGDVAYDLLGSLSAAGMVPDHTLMDFFRGDRLYTRQEIARIVASIRTDNSEAATERATGLAALQREFAPELKELGIVPPPMPTTGSTATGAYKLRLLTEPDAASQIVRGSLTAPVGRDGFATVSAGTYRREFDGRGYPSIETAYVRVDGRALDVSIGLMPLRWGPGYSGALMIGDSARSVPMVHVEKGFKLPGSLGRRIGPLHFSQFAGEFWEEDIPTAESNARGTKRYFLGRRIETAGPGRFQLSLAESFKSTKLPDPWFAMVLPYYLYQNDWTIPGRYHWLDFLASDRQPNTRWLNYLAEIELTYRAQGDSLLYGSLLLDDQQAPSGLGLGNETPGKLGYQAGIHLPGLGGGRYGARLEYTVIDGNTYTNESKPVEWDRNSMPLGYPTGPNSKVLFGRFDARLSPRLQAAVDGSIRRVRHSSRPGVRSDALGLYASYALRDDAFVGLRLDHDRETLPGEAERKRTRFEVNAGIGF